MVRPASNMLLVGAAVLVMLSAVCKAASITACPSKTGYDAVPDWTCSPTKSSDLLKYSSTAAAEAACRANSNCVCFNSAGDVFLSKNTQGSSQRGCAYVKQACDPKTGYETLGKVKIASVKQGGGKESNEGSSAAAELACNADSKCLAFNDAGMVITKVLVVDTNTVTTSCAYKKAREQMAGVFRLFAA
ncbi:hypothetical protein Vretimale_2278 [Volvox reticuliferus]|nr:hypothetical protein Vretimale_2278 [Volvox reticuliferus]